MGGLCFVNTLCGRRNTLVESAIQRSIRSKKCEVLTVAFSAFAAYFLDSRREAHFTLNISVPVPHQSTALEIYILYLPICNIEKHCQFGTR